LPSIESTSPEILSSTHIYLSSVQVSPLQGFDDIYSSPTPNRLVRFYQWVYHPIAPHMSAFR
ncbi:hypothetical protein MJO28_010370, partial [Puccinia striiformis f. sp. tritici]